MKNQTAHISPVAYARTAGIGYLVIIIAGILSEFFIRSNMIVPGDAAATAGNIMQSESLFRMSIAGDLIMLIFDVIVAMALYVLLERVNKGLALLATFFRLVHTAVYGAGLLNLFLVLLSLGNGGSALSSGVEQSSILAQTFLGAHGIAYAVGLVFFGVHCLLLGYLIFKSGFLPRLLGILLLIAGLGYLTDSFAQVLLSNYADYGETLAVVVFVPALIGELSLALWLLLKGVSMDRWEAA